jgi:hypothetical protein
VTETPIYHWAIEDIVPAHPHLYLEHCAIMAVALLKNDSGSPCRFQVKCHDVGLPGQAKNSSFYMDVSWSPQIDTAAHRILATEQARPIVERAAVAMAAMLFGQLMPDCQLQVTRQGEKADYWLTGLRCALEVSGTERFREMSRRGRQKRAQLLANARGWNGYTVVCCFSASRRLIHWSYHTQEESRP